MKLKKRRKLVTYLNILDQPIRFNPFLFSRTFLLWAMLGLIGGFISGLYWIVLEFLTHQIAYFEGWRVIPAMAICGLLAGLVIHFIGDPGKIHLIVNNIRFNKGKLDPKNNPSMILSSLLCVASGGSLGPEAPLVQVTGSMGTWLGKLFRVKGEALRSLSIAGMASGFTALFGAPLGGSLFAITATAIGWVFIYCTKFFKLLFEKRAIPIYIKTLIGGILLGTIAFYFPITRYFGHHEINELLLGDFSIKLLLLIMIFKIIAISITVTSGWRGGFIIPLFFVGATLGLLIHHLFPDTSLTLAIISCMAGINACVTRTPMSTTILLATLTGFSYFIPLLFASLTGYFLAPKIPFISSQMEKG